MKRKRPYLTKSRLRTWCAQQLPKDINMKAYSLHVTVEDSGADAVLLALESAVLHLKQWPKTVADLRIDNEIPIPLAPTMPEDVCASFHRYE